MMCSSEELGLGKGEDGLLILTPRQPAVGTPLNSLYGAPDTVLEISVTPNRGDCLGLRGVARDLAAALGLTLKPLTVKTAAGLAAAPSASDAVKFVRSTSEFCPYYTLRTLKNVKVGPSPAWLRRDLEAAGLRPINNVVDITNWLLLELGQPLHAFDAQKVSEGIEARPAREGEEIVLLDGKKVKLEPGVCVIADAQRPLVVAGVMGGVDSGVTDSTTDVLLEAAWFRPGEIRRVARRLGVSTDSSHRFARDVDPSGVELASRLATDLLVELAGAQVVGPAIAVGQPPRADVIIDLPAGYVAAKLGTPVADADVNAAFARLGFTAAPGSPGGGPRRRRLRGSRALVSQAATRGGRGCRDARQPRRAADLPRQAWLSVPVRHDCRQARGRRLRRDHPAGGLDARRPPPRPAYPRSRR
jgi:phenylalanyl-tRNA synthetase beta chain